MNERIVKLFMRSVDSKYIPLPVEDHIPLWTEKFVELIVRECAGVCDDQRDSTDSEFGKLVAEGCALKIMERFGVE